MAMGEDKIFWAGLAQCTITWIIRSGVVQKPLKFRGSTTLKTVGWGQLQVQKPLKFRRSTTRYNTITVIILGMEDK